MSYYSDTEIPRAEEANPEGLTKLELVERTRAINEIKKQYPNVSPVHIEWCWNYIHRTGLEKVREQINTGFFDKPSQFTTSKNVCSY
jgi:hypothetical protein